MKIYVITKNGQIVTGYTNMDEAKALVEKLKADRCTIDDSISIHFKIQEVNIVK